MERTDEAIKLFEKNYGKTPKEAGYPVMDIYKKQHAFLYADSEETIKAYKLQQNIIRGVLMWGLWPLILVMINYANAAVWYHDAFHWRCVATYIFLAIWVILFIVLYIKSYKAERHFKLGKNITYLNY